jgi:hypothetical protein
MSEQNNLDYAARMLANNMPRRQALRLILAGVAGAALGALGLPKAWATTCPSGKVLCGPAGCVPNGTCCNSKTGAVCPSSQCYNPGTGYLCCPTGRVVCGNKRCCAKGEVCAGTKCCAANKVCKGKCCGPNEQCVKTKCVPIISPSSPA